MRGKCAELERKCAELEKARDATDLALAMTQKAAAGANKGTEGREGRNAIEPKSKVVGGGLGDMFQHRLSPKLRPLKNTIVPKVFFCRTCTHFHTFSPSRSCSRNLC